MPAAKSMDTHEKVLNLGREWSGPMRMLPVLEKAM